MIFRSLAFLLLFIAHGENLVFAENETLRYVALGDSYSSGKGVTPAESWPAQLAGRLNEEGLKIEEIANLAQPGNTSTQVLEHQIPQLKTLKPQLLSLQIGVNDWVHGFTSKRYRKEIILVLDSLLKIMPSRKILIVTAPEFSCSPTGKKWGYGKSAVNGIERMNRILVEEARNRQLTTVDLFPLSQELCSKTGMFSNDGMHPSAKQYQLWVNALLPATKKMLGARSR